jgi:TRAP-type C4-dicarboxylate transport system substrate-binding protein
MTVNLFFRFFLFVVTPLWIAACEQAEMVDDGDIAVTNEIKLTVAGTTFPNTEGERHWLSFSEAATKLSNGSLKPKMLIYGQLGSEEQIISGLRRGRVQFANVSAMALSTLVPEAALLYAPFLFASESEADFILDYHLTPLYREMLSKKGLHLVTWYEIGFIQVYGKEPLLVPADAEGRRFRVGAGIASRLFAEAIDADVIPLGFTDVVAGLQTGLVDAGENSVSLYARSGIANEAGHLTKTNHSYGLSMIVAQKDWWDSQPSHIQFQLGQAFPDISVSRIDVRAESLRDLENAKDLGIAVHKLDEAQEALWMEKVIGLRKRLVLEIGGRSEEVFDAIQAGRIAFLSDRGRNKDL